MTNPNVIHRFAYASQTPQEEFVHHILEQLLEIAKDYDAKAKRKGQFLYVWDELLSFRCFRTHGEEECVMLFRVPEREVWGEGGSVEEVLQSAVMRLRRLLQTWKKTKRKQTAKPSFHSELMQYWREQIPKMGHVMVGEGRISFERFALPNIFSPLPHQELSLFLQENVRKEEGVIELLALPENTHRCIVDTYGIFPSLDDAYVLKHCCLAFDKKREKMFCVPMFL